MTARPAAGRDSFQGGSPKEQHDFIDFAVTAAEASADTGRSVFPDGGPGARPGKER